MLSSMTKKGAESTLLAMEYGAVDFIAKPSGTISLDLHKIKNELIEKVENAATVTNFKDGETQLLKFLTNNVDSVSNQ